MRSWANRRKNTLLWLYGSTAQELWTATLVNKLPLGQDALHVDFQKIKKQSHKTQIPCVLTLTLFKEFILLTLNDKFAPQFLSNISRNSNCFLFFPLILCIKWWLPHSQPVPHQKFHLCTLENKNHLQSLSPLIHHHKVFNSSDSHSVRGARTAPLLLLLSSSPQEQGFRAQDTEKDLEILSASQPAAVEQRNLRPCPWSPNPPMRHTGSPARASSWLISWKVSTGFLMAKEDRQERKARMRIGKWW